MDRNKLVANIFVVPATLPEMKDIDRMTLAAMDFAVGTGRLIMFRDGEKGKCGRDVNFLTTVTGHGDIWKEITIMEILDKIQQGTRLNIQDNYIGKVSNRYDSKLQMVMAISLCL